ncbi:hypothetical protein SAMN05720468_10627 [Fibrobacter sp. UWEL]|nr:hypothetical protein SAMN05720468_10627 [Fibrobacter sp. UWEL]
MVLAALIARQKSMNTMMIPLIVSFVVRLAMDQVALTARSACIVMDVVQNAFGAVRQVPVPAVRIAPLECMNVNV